MKNYMSLAFDDGEMLAEKNNHRMLVAKVVGMTLRCLSNTPRAILTIIALLA